MAVPHQAVAAVGKLQALHCEEKRLGLHLDCLRKQLPRTRSQDIRQWIVELVGLTQRDNVDILAHGVSLSLRGSGRLRHPPRYAAYLIPSSPSFPHSSGVRAGIGMVGLARPRPRTSEAGFPNIPACTVEPYRRPARLMFEGELDGIARPRVQPAVRIKIVNGD